MFNLKAIFAALFCSVAPMATLVEQPPKEEKVAVAPLLLGKDTVSSVRSAYESGQYTLFLKEMDESYKTADLKGLIEMRSKQVPLEFQEEWSEKFLTLQKEKNQELLAALSEKDDSLFAEKVRSLAAVLTPEQEKALSRLNSFISMAPNSGANADENALIQIDLEYEYKLLHADLPTTDVSSQERLSQSLALRMEKMDKMVKAAKNFQDLQLKQAVGIASDTLDVRLARNLDGKDLNALVKSKAPVGAREEKVVEILSFYQGKFSDLMKEIEHANR